MQHASLGGCQRSQLVSQLVFLQLASSNTRLHDGWPDNCCRLESTQMNFGGMLPEDYVSAGKSLGQQFAYVINPKYDAAMIFKSERPDLPPFYPYNHCKKYNNLTSYEILTNPNKCELSYYKLRYDAEEFNNLTGHLFPNERKFAPALAGYYFGRYKFADNLTAPAFHRGDYTFGCSLNTSTTATVVGSSSAGHEILTVKCLQSQTPILRGMIANQTGEND